MSIAARQRRWPRRFHVSGSLSSLWTAARSPCPAALSLPRLPLPALSASSPQRAPPSPPLLCPSLLARAILPRSLLSLLSLVCRVCLPHAVISRVHFMSQPFLLKVSCSLAFTSWVPWIALSPGRSLLHAHPQPCGQLSPRSLRLAVATRGGSSTLPRYSIPASAGSSQQSSL